MTEAERLVADYAGTGLTIGRHPMALRRDELAMRGVMRACDLRIGAAGPPRARGRHGHYPPAAGDGERASCSSPSKTKPASPTSSCARICSPAIGSSSSRSRSSSSTACCRTRMASPRCAPSRSAASVALAGRRSRRHRLRRARLLLDRSFLRFHPSLRHLPAKSVIAPCILSAHRSPDLPDPARRSAGTVLAERRRRDCAMPLGSGRSLNV